MVPRHDISSRVQAQEEEDQRCHEGESAEEVDTFDLRLVSLLDGNVDRNDAEDASDDDEGYLDEKGISPAQSVVDNCKVLAW